MSRCQHENTILIVIVNDSVYCQKSTFAVFVIRSSLNSAKKHSFGHFGQILSMFNLNR